MAADSGFAQLLDDQVVYYHVFEGDLAGPGFDFLVHGVPVVYPEELGVQSHDLGVQGDVLRVQGHVLRVKGDVLGVQGYGLRVQGDVLGVQGHVLVVGPHAVGCQLQGFLGRRSLQL